LQAIAIMTDIFSIETSAPQPTLAMRFRSPVSELPRRFGECYSAIADYLARRGQLPAGPPFAMYHDLDPNALDVEAGFPVSSAMPGEGMIQASALPAGETGTGLHVGSYARLAETYDALNGWLSSAGWMPHGPFWESYLDSPLEKSESELRTLLHVPVARRDRPA
jgi:effector-binding domain-containing protein